MTKPDFLTRRRALTLMIGAALTFAFNLYAGAQSLSVLRPQIEDAIRSITTQSGEFMQIDTSTGRGEQGTYMISRPGRLRFEYDVRPEILLSDGQYVARVNTQTNAVSRVRLNATPLRILLSDEVDLTDGVTITQMEQTPDSLFVTFFETGKRDRGLITVFLDVESFELRGWKIEENDGLVTTIILQNTQTGVELDPRDFEIPS